jgi:hypothetical protein
MIARGSRRSDRWNPLEVGSSGFLGLAEKKLVPVDAIIRLYDDVVQISPGRGRLCMDR